MFFPKVLWVDGTYCKVSLEPQVSTLSDQIMDEAKTREELQKQRSHNNFVVGAAKFKNGNIAFAENGTYQATVWSAHGKKVNGRWSKI